MTPASTPIARYSEPRVGEICCSLWTWKLMGSAPLRNWLASVSPDSRVKSPVICARPSVTGVCEAGADSTRPSSTIANWL